MDLGKKIDFPDKKFCFNIILTHSRNNQRRSKDRIYAIEILSLTLLWCRGAQCFRRLFLHKKKGVGPKFLDFS